MASTNQSPFYQKAESNFLAAKTDDDKLYWLDEMIKECPKHKSAEAMLANLKTRRKKLMEKRERGRKAKGKSGKIGIKKEELQVVIVGKTNVGKSSLVSALTSLNPPISEIPFTTKSPIIGMMNYNGTPIQLIEIPAIGSEYYDKGIAYTSDLVIVLVDEMNQIDEVTRQLENIPIKKLIVFNKIDLLEENEKRRLEARLKSRKLNFIMISTATGENLEQLKEKVFVSFNRIRVYTKEPGKSKSEKPIVLEQTSTVKEVANKIFKGFSKSVVETKIWGPSSKFPGQKVGLNHMLKDLDVVEFKTR